MIDSANAFLKEIKSVKPERKKHDVYKKYFFIYSGLYHTLKKTFAAIEHAANE